MASLSEILKEKISKGGFSKTYVASQLEVGERTIEYYMSGEREPSIEGLIKLSIILGFQLNELSEQNVRQNNDATKPQESNTRKKESAPALLKELHDKVDSNLNVLLTELQDIYNQQVQTRAEVRGYGQRQIYNEVNWDTQKFLKVMAEVGKLTENNLKSDPQLGSKTGARKRRKNQE